MVGLGEYGGGTLLDDWIMTGELRISGDDVLVFVVLLDVMDPADPSSGCSLTSLLYWWMSGHGRPTTGTGMSLCTGLTSCQCPLCNVTNANPSSPGS
jgi:hypothetical protein